MKEIKVLNYKVNIRGGALDDIIGKRCIIISDSNVYPLYGPRIEKNFDEAIQFVIPAGEESKSIRVYEELLTFLVKNEVNKYDELIALGGGVVGDLAGFAAATYMRGIRYIQVPTTLLSAIDSSIGGKTAINFAGIKNLIGAIHQPEAVYFDPQVLDTLDRRQFNSGMAEAIKYVVLTGDEQLISIIEELSQMAGGINSAEDIRGKHADEKVKFNQLIEEMVLACIKIKASYVQQDPLDAGPRRMLNLGHTVGHAVETLSEYQLLHGEAVSIGMMAMAKFGEMSGISKLKELLEMFSLPTEINFNIEDIKEKIKKDKKVLGESITLVIPKAFGNCELRKVKL